jgi:hypothetical protein
MLMVSLVSGKLKVEACLVSLRPNDHQLTNRQAYCCTGLAAEQLMTSPAADAITSNPLEYKKVRNTQQLPK